MIGDPSQYINPPKPKKPQQPISTIGGLGFNPLAPHPIPKGVGKKGSGGKGSKGVPIDSQGRIDLSQIAAQRLNFLDQYNQQVADINRNYNVQVQRAKQNEPYVQRSIISDYAGRGMGFSSGYGNAAGRETQLYNQNLSDLAYQHNYGLQDLDAQRAAMRRTLDVQREAIRQAAADRMAAQAGSLGLGSGKHQGKNKINRHLGLSNKPKQPKHPKNVSGEYWTAG